jgi:hypothetical protein
VTRLIGKREREERGGGGEREREREKRCEDKGCHPLQEM